MIGCNKDSAFRRAVNIIEIIIHRWREGCELFSPCGQIMQRMVIDACSKLIAHLCSHKRMRNTILLKIVVQSHKIKSQFLRHNIYACTTRKSWIEVHHAGIEAITCIGCHTMLGLQTIETLIPVTERDEIGMCKLASLRNARRTRSVEQNEQVVR